MLIQTYYMHLKQISEQREPVLYHGSDSQQIIGPLRVNERDSGWFGAGFYLTARPEYAQRWGKYVYQMSVPQGSYAEVQVIGNYDKVKFIGKAEQANQAAGGTEAWIENEVAWSNAFTKNLKQMGFIGVRVHLDQNKDAEVLIFDPSQIQVIGQIGKPPQ